MSFDVLKNDAFVGGNADAVETLQRREARQRVLLRAKLHPIDCQAEMQVTDLSRSGLRGITDLRVGIDQSVFVSLDDITHCSGTVRWTQDRRIGVKFGKTLDMLPEAVSMDAGVLPSHQERMPRIPTYFAARITVCTGSSSAKIRNVSKTGMLIETEMELTINKKLLVSLSDGRILTADVKWVQGERVGVQLSNPVSILQFAYGDLH